MGFDAQPERTESEVTCKWHELLAEQYKDGMLIKGEELYKLALRLESENAELRAQLNGLLEKISISPNDFIKRTQA